MAREERIFPIETMGGRLQSLRKSKGYDRVVFHALVCPDVPLEKDSRQKTVHNWESGKTSPDYDTLKKMCRILDCDTDYLLCMQESPRKETADISSATGLSEKAADYLRTLKNEPYKTEILNGLILSEHFSAMMEQLEAAVECREPAHAKFVKEYADDVQKIINELETLSGQEITESYIPNRELTLDSKRFDEALSTLSVLAPNMTAISREDAIKPHLQEAQYSFRRAAEEVI